MRPEYRGVGARETGEQDHIRDMDVVGRLPDHHGLLQGRRVTGHPAFTSQLTDGRPAAERVVVDGTCVTSQGPGTAIEFALALVALLFDEAKAQEVAGPMLVA